MPVQARLEPGPFDPSEDLARLFDAAKGDGAVVSFVGLARPTAKSGEPVDALILEDHPRLSLQSLKTIAEDAAKRFDVSHVLIVHKSGRIAPGEPIVLAAATSAHRRAAFEAADYLMDRLKTEAVFWKREEGAAGSNWIEPTEADYAERGRWE